MSDAPWIPVVAGATRKTLADNTDVAPVSGRQEYLENLINRYCGN